MLEVIGRTPLGIGADADALASNVQSVDAEALEGERALGIADFMRRNLASVFVNEAQSNPLQPDVQYRGFVGSPLLGLPQGIAVYQDGVRINEPFGDTVNWALIPESAIDSVYLMPGSNPLFGLNALGGAIAIETKDGFSHQRTRGEVYGGSFGRFGASIETGGVRDERLGYFVTASWLEEDGWRNFSPTEALQIFGNVGWQLGATSVDLNVTLADTDLIGNGPAPVELLGIDREAIFTRPDITENELHLLNLVIEHELTDWMTLTGNVYMRSSDIDTLNGDDSEFEACEGFPGFVCEEDDGQEELVLDHNDQPVAADDAVEGATVNRSATRQDTRGFAWQAAWTGRLANRSNHFVAGIAYDDSEVDFASNTALGALDETRFAVPTDIFVGEAFTSLQAETRNIGFFVTDTLSLTDNVILTLSGRFNDTDVVLRDRIGTALDGDHNFDRFNPAVGITARLEQGLMVYASFSESNRAPSPVELTCADEDDPCRLPNAFLADPPLEQVVASTIETGFRGTFDGGSWHAGIFRTTNEDDILFISAGALTNQGFFDNVGKTRRDGMELSVEGQSGDRFSWFANYTWLDATFRQGLTFQSPNNPESIDGEISVRPGDRLPLIPDQLLKGGMRVALDDRWSLAVTLLAGSDFPMRGDEGNDFASIGDYAVFNLRGEYRLNDRALLFLNADNVLDEDYETFGLFGEPDEVLGDEFEDSRFLSPAAPRAAWLGIEVEF